VTDRWSRGMGSLRSWPMSNRLIPTVSERRDVWPSGSILPICAGCPATVAAQRMLPKRTVTAAGVSGSGPVRHSISTATGTDRR
jgi:hypothetical protein